MDSYFFNLIHSFAGRWKALDWLGIFFAEYLGYIFLLVVVFLFFKQQKIQEKIYFFSIISLSAILSRGIFAEIIKFFVERPRPFLTLDFKPLIESNGVSMSMPSGHAAFYFALAFALFIFNKKIGWYFTGAAILMGIARIFTGVHWPTDILVGIVIGALSVILIKKILSISVTKTA